MRYFAYRTWQIQQAKADSGHMTQRHRIMDLCLIFPVSREQSPHHMPSSLQHPGSAPVIAIGVFLFNKPIPYILTESYPYIAFCYFKVYLTPLPAPVFSRFSFQSGCSEYVLLLLFSISAAFSISDLDIFFFPLRMLTSICSASFRS